MTLNSLTFPDLTGIPDSDDADPNAYTITNDEGWSSNFTANGVGGSGHTKYQGTSNAGQAYLWYSAGYWYLARVDYGADPTGTDYWIGTIALGLAPANNAAGHITLTPSA